MELDSIPTGATSPTLLPGVGVGRVRAFTGLLDGFAWPLRTADYLELVDPLWNGREMRARIVEVIDETPDARTLRLRPSRAWKNLARPRAGQHVSVSVAVDGQRHRRTYSISSAPERGGGTLDITVKALPGGRVSRHL